MRPWVIPYAGAARPRVVTGHQRTASHVMGYTHGVLQQNWVLTHLAVIYLGGDFYAVRNVGNAQVPTKRDEEFEVSFAESLELALMFRDGLSWTFLRQTSRKRRSASGLPVSGSHVGVKHENTPAKRAKTS
ncbi:hypothetical protein HDU86_005938 [Geranomyces michiganensis]|nr:hypothetical protein HDU86_005938 [Geranomyces michiganensis]